MAMVQFGVRAVDMRDTEYYGIPEVANLDLLLTSFVSVYDEVLVNTSTLVSVASYDSGGTRIVTTLEGNFSFGQVSRFAVEAAGIRNDVTGTFQITQAGDLYGTATGGTTRYSGTGELLVSYTGLSVPIWSDALNVALFEDVVTLAGSDTISGSGGNDYLLGYGGDDTLIGGAGDDVLMGGPGNDVYVIDSPGDTVVEIANEGTDTVYSPFTFTLHAHIEQLVLTGTANIDGIGNDASNSIIGNDGDNVLVGGGGVDTLRGGRGNDRYVITSTRDTVDEYANEGIDTIVSPVSIILPPAIENVLLTGSQFAFAHGNALANELIGNDGENPILGLDGDDRIFGNGGNDSLYGNEGNDYLDGGAGDDVLTGNAGDDRLVGGEGNDRFYGGDGRDFFDGGPGSDTADYSAFSLAVTVHLDQGWAVKALGSIDTWISVENAIGSFNDDVIFGHIGTVNTISGDYGDDYLFFDAGDIVSGGPGVDRAVVIGSLGVSVTTSDIEWLWGSNAADVVHVTSPLAVTLFGMGGDDTLTGGTGVNYLYGQDGADILIGGRSDDWLYIDSQDVSGGSIQGGEGSDRAASLDGSVISIDLAVSSIEWVWASNHGDNLDGTGQISNLYLFAFDGADTLRGGMADDNIYGMAGADAMYGNAGDDVLYFDSDDTVVDGGADYDVAQVLDYTGLGVHLNLATSEIEVVYASNQSDTLDATTATWAVYMNGYNGDDVMSGGSGDDNIYGGGGADTIAGGGGNDFLDGSGGPETDTLVVTGIQSEYLLHYTSGVLTSVQDLVDGRDGWDNVVGFERIQFGDSAPGNLFVV